MSAPLVRAGKAMGAGALGHFEAMGRPHAVTFVMFSKAGRTRANGLTLGLLVAAGGWPLANQFSTTLLSANIGYLTTAPLAVTTLGFEA